MSSRSSTTPTTDPIYTHHHTGLNHLASTVTFDCRLGTLAPLPTSSLSTGLLARSFHALVALASTDAPATVSKGPAHSPLSGRVGECASPFLRNRAWTDLDHGNRGMDRGDSLLMPCQAWFIVGPSNYIQVPKFSRLRTSEHAKLPIQVGSSGRSAGRQACVEILTFMAG